MTLAKAQPCLSQKKNLDFHERKKRVFCFFLFRESHGFASARGTVVLSRESRPCLSKTKENTFSVFFSFTRVTVLLPREAWLCFRESHGRASRKGKTKRVFYFFSFVRVTVLLPREARLCFRESHGRAS